MKKLIGDAIVITAWFVIAFIIIIWPILYISAELIDKEHCIVNGAKHEITTLTLQGYCSIDGVIVPATEVGK